MYQSLRTNVRRIGRYGVRRLWMMLKERHPDWTVPEGRVHRALARLRADARAVEEQAAGAAAAMPAELLDPTEEGEVCSPQVFPDAGHPACACSIRISRESC